MVRKETRQAAPPAVPAVEAEMVSGGVAAGMHLVNAGAASAGDRHPTAGETPRTADITHVMSHCSAWYLPQRDR